MVDEKAFEKWINQEIMLLGDEKYNLSNQAIQWASKAWNAASARQQPQVSVEGLRRPITMLVGYCDSVDALPPSLKAWSDELKGLAGDLWDAWEDLTHSANTEAPPAKQGAEECFDTCPHCCGTGCCGHPDSGAGCGTCNSTGAIKRAMLDDDVVLAEKYLSELCASGGKSWCLSIPAQECDIDLVFQRIINRAKRGGLLNADPTTPQSPPATEQMREALPEKIRCMMQAHLDGVYVFSARENCDSLLRDVFTYALATPPKTGEQPEKASVVVGPAYITDKVLPDEALIALTTGKAKPEEYGMVPTLHREAVPMTDAEREKLVQDVRDAIERQYEAMGFERGEGFSAFQSATIGTNTANAALSAIEQRFALVRKA